MARFSELLRSARQKRGISQEALAPLAGYKHGAYARVERGEVDNPEPWRLGRLSQELGIPIIDMYRAAGWVALGDDSGAEITELWPRIPTDEREVVMKIIRHLAGAPPAKADQVSA